MLLSGIENQIVLVGGTVDYFKKLWDLIFKKSFFTSTVLKLMIYCYQGGLETSSLQYFYCYLMKVGPILSQIFVD